MRHVKIKSLLNCSVSEIKADFDKVYGDSALSYPTVARLSARFRDCRETVEDDSHSGRPSTAYCENDIIGKLYPRKILPAVVGTIKKPKHELEYEVGSCYMTMPLHINLQQRWTT